MKPGAGERPGLRPGVRLDFDPVRGQPVLLFPEGVLLLNDTAAAVVQRCDTERTAGQIVADLQRSYAGVTAESVLGVLADLAGRGVVGTGPGTHAARPVPAGPVATPPPAPAPLGLLAELTYRCPLQCTYCANPVNLADFSAELDTAAWSGVFAQARRMGVLQLHLSGGEPALRRDLVDLTAEARRLGFYTNLVTSGISLGRARLTALAEAGLDHFQLSLQDADAEGARAVAGRPVHDRKLAVARQVRALGLPLTINVVLHRGNVGRMLRLAELAVQLGADRVELAHTQFYGWALRNRSALLPTRAQIEQANADIAVARERFGDRIEIIHVQADYYDPRPKPCNYGWGERQLVVAPNGDTLPCLAAGSLPGFEVPSVRTRELAEIWYDSPAFTRFRGTDWLPDPCHGCALKEVDFGGCRCQAFQLTGDPAVTDPVCELSEHHDLVLRQLDVEPVPAVPRRP